MYCVPLYVIPGIYRWILNFQSPRDHNKLFGDWEFDFSKVWKSALWSTNCNFYTKRILPFFNRVRVVKFIISLCMYNLKISHWKIVKLNKITVYSEPHPGGTWYWLVRMYFRPEPINHTIQRKNNLFTIIYRSISMKNTNS